MLKYWRHIHIYITKQVSKLISRPWNQNLLNPFIYHYSLKVTSAAGLSQQFLLPTIALSLDMCLSSTDAAAWTGCLCWIWYEKPHNTGDCSLLKLLVRIDRLYIERPAHIDTSSGATYQKHTDETDHRVKYLHGRKTEDIIILAKDKKNKNVGIITILLNLKMLFKTPLTR